MSPKPTDPTPEGRDPPTPPPEVKKERKHASKEYNNKRDGRIQQHSMMEEGNINMGSSPTHPAAIAMGGNELEWEEEETT